MRFLQLNPHGIVSAALVGSVAVVATVYLVAVYSTFRLGFMLQEQAGIETKLHEANVKFEFEKQQKNLALPQAHAAFLQSMEKVSVVRYLQSKSVAISPVVPLHE